MGEEQAMTKTQKYRAKRKVKGLCAWCGNQSRPGKVLCEECAKNAKETKQFYLNMGFCPVCHKYRIYGSEKECPECRARRIVNNQVSATKAWAMGKSWADPRKATVRSQERYKRLKSEGLCAKCGKRPPAIGRVMCRPCLDKLADGMRQHRAKLREAKKEARS